MENDPATTPTPATEAAAPATPGSRRTLYLLLGPIVALTGLAYLGDALAPTLAVEHPVWLILLNTRKRYLALTVTRIDPVTFFVVGVARQMLADPLYFLLGRRYGDSGVRWLERKLGDGAASVTIYEEWFKKAAYPMVAIAPNAIISILAGASKMKAGVFLVLNLGGTVVTLILLRIFGDAFSAPLESILDFLGRYQWPLTAVSVVLVAVLIVTGKKSGTSDLESLSEMERELNQAAEEPGPGEAGPGPS